MSDVAGNYYAKQCIEDAFILPSIAQNLFKGEFKSWNKILLYGVNLNILLKINFIITKPPGVGKTMIAQAVANEINATTFWVSMADVTSKFIGQAFLIKGESEKLLRLLFEVAK